MDRICRYLLLILFCQIVWAPPGLSASSGRAYDKAREAYYKLQASPRKQKYRENWLEVAGLFLEAERSANRGGRADDALFMAGKTMQGLYGKSFLADDARQAVLHFDRLIRIHPDSSLADDALFLAAAILEENLNSPTEAYLRYQRIIKEYADGDMVVKARPKSEALKSLVSPSQEESQPESRTASSPVVGSVLKQLRYSSYAGLTRVVVEVTGEPDFSPMRLNGDTKAGIPARVLVDVPATSISADIDREIVIGDGRVRKVRTGQFAPGVARVVLELDGHSEFKVFALENPSRVILDVGIPSTPQATEATTQPAETSPPARKGGTAESDGDGIALVLDQAPVDEPLKVAIPAGERKDGVFRIVIDAGHGGKDPGAIGPKGTREKDVTLSMAKVLAESLRKDLGCEVVLTRDNDVYLTLNERTAIANRVDADLFISLHANANHSSGPYGIETYYLNFSKNEKAMAVAARENDTTLKEVGDLELILLDLMANSKINESSRLAAEIQKALIDHLNSHFSRIKDLGVRQGPFYVLLGATMPSVLVETAFISNHREETRLKSRKYQVKTAEAITKGVAAYLKSFNIIATR